MSIYTAERVLDVVSSVNIYPIKGCHAATVNGKVPTSLTVGETGFEVNGVRDRDWVLYDPNERVFVSQRGWNADERLRHPTDRQLARVAIDIQDEKVVVTSENGTLELPAMPGDGAQLDMSIFGKQLPAVRQSPKADDYFSRLLGREVWLVRSDRHQRRQLPEQYRREGAFNTVAAADGMPFLLTNEMSLAAAHAATNVPAGTVPITRYRGNIVVAGTGLGPFGEDYIPGDQQFRIGDIGMWAVKACSRCPVPNIDQETGELAGKALTVLRGRKGRIPGGTEGIFFGQNLVHANLGSISVGDRVVVPGLAAEPNINFV